MQLYVLLCAPKALRERESAPPSSAAAANSHFHRFEWRTDSRLFFTNRCGRELEQVYVMLLPDESRWLI